MKQILLILGLLKLVNSVQAQTWSGATPGDIYYNGGKVGIGAQSPMSILHVHNATIPANTIGATEEIANFSGVAGNLSQFKFLLRRHSLIGSAGGGWMDIGSRLQFRTDVSDQGYLEFNPQGGTYGVAIGSTQGEIMRFNQNRNVGIGVTNPWARLDVRTGGTNGGDQNALNIQNPSADAWATVMDEKSSSTCWRM